MQLFPCEWPTVFMNGLMLGALCPVLNNEQKRHQLSELESDRQDRQSKLSFAPVCKGLEIEIATAT